MRISLLDEGSVVLFCPEDTEARDWFDDNVEYEGWQALGKNIAVDARYAPELVGAFLSDGGELVP